MNIALIDERVSKKIEESLLAKGFLPIRAPKSERLAPDVASHPDILLFKDGNTVISSRHYRDEAPQLFESIGMHNRDIKFRFTDDLQGAQYPADCIYNALIAGKRIFCKTDSISGEVLSYAREKKYDIIPVRQGYPACTVLMLGEEYALTSDDGMASVLQSNGVEVFKIRNGHISLPSREYGFIGGACGAFGDTLYFLGSIELHPDFDIIKTPMMRQVGPAPTAAVLRPAVILLL